MERKPSAIPAHADDLAAQIVVFDRAGDFETKRLLKENEFERTELVGDRQGRLYVRKVLHDVSMAGPSAPRAETCSTALHHPYERLEGKAIKYLPRVHHVARFGDELLVVAEHIDGEDLRHHVSRRGPLDFQGMLCIARCVTEALEALHGFAGGAIVHRDVNPGNIVVCSRAASGSLEADDVTEAYLIDLGIARSWNEDARSDTHIWGTSGYTAPEQFGFRQTDARSDEYSLAVTVGFMLTGLEGDAFLKSDALNRLSSDVALVLGRALSLDPADRYPTVRAFYEALARCSQKECRRAEEARGVTIAKTAPDSDVVSTSVSQPTTPPTSEETRVLVRESTPARVSGKNPDSPPKPEVGQKATQVVAAEGSEPYAEIRTAEEGNVPHAQGENPRTANEGKSARKRAICEKLWFAWQIAVMTIAGLCAVSILIAYFAPDQAGATEADGTSMLNMLSLVVFWFCIPAVVLANPGRIIDRIPGLARWLERQRRLKLLLILAASICAPFVLAVVASLVAMVV